MREEYPEWIPAPVRKEPLGLRHFAPGRLAAMCNACDRAVLLDRDALVKRGWGGTPVHQLPFRCRTCGSRDVSVMEGEPRLLAEFVAEKGGG